MNVIITERVATDINAVHLKRLNECKSGPNISVLKVLREQNEESGGAMGGGADGLCVSC